MYSSYIIFLVFMQYIFIIMFIHNIIIRIGFYLFLSENLWVWVINNSTLDLFCILLWLKVLYVLELLLCIVFISLNIWWLLSLALYYFHFLFFSLTYIHYQVRICMTKLDSMFHLICHLSILVHFFLVECWKSFHWWVFYNLKHEFVINDHNYEHVFSIFLNDELKLLNFVIS